MTDDAGRFELTGLSAGPYALTAARTGFVTMKFGQSRPGDRVQTITIAGEEVVEGIEVALPRGGVVAGVVIDERGEPVVNSIVQVLRQQWVRGMRQPVSDPSYVDRTDDLGGFRLHGLPPGSYLLSASLAPIEATSLATASSSIGSVTTFFPGTLSPAEAQPLRIDAGQDVSGLVLALAPGRQATISGVVQTADGQPVGAASVSLGHTSAFSGASGWRSARARSDGTFSFPNMPPGEYSVVVEVNATRTPSTLNAGAQVAVAHVVLDGSDVVVPLVLREGDHARGRITFDPDPDRGVMTPGLVIVSFDAANPAETFRATSPLSVNSDWTFDIGGLIGRRLLRVREGQGDWVLKRVTLGGTDITDTPLEFTGADINDIQIVLTDRVTNVSGTIVDADGQPVPGATVVLLAEDRGKWGPDSRFVVAVRADQNGSFQHRKLPPERYLAVAVGELEPGEETNPETLDRLQRAASTAFTLGEGETRTLSVRLSEQTR
jgi:hypothetical protein